MLYNIKWRWCVCVCVCVCIYIYIYIYIYICLYIWHCSWGIWSLCIYILTNIGEVLNWDKDGHVYPLCMTCARSIHSSLSCLALPFTHSCFLPHSPSFSLSLFVCLSVSVCLSVCLSVSLCLSLIFAEKTNTKGLNGYMWSFCHDILWTVKSDSAKYTSVWVKAVRTATNRYWDECGRRYC